MATSLASSQNYAATAFSFPNVTQLASVKLMVLIILRGFPNFFLLQSHEILGTVDGSEPCPHKFLYDDQGKTTCTLNHDFC
jgi:hypothetical protein